MQPTDDPPPPPRRRITGAAWLAGVLGVLLAVILLFIVALIFRGESPVEQEPSFVEYSTEQQTFALKEGGSVALGYMILVPDEDVGILTQLMRDGGAQKVSYGLARILASKSVEELDRDIAVRRVLSEEIESLLMREVVDPYNASEEGEEHPIQIHDVYIYHYELQVAPQTD